MSFILNMCIFILMLFSQCLFAISDNFNCSKVSDCKCVFQTGMGINLLPLNKEQTWLNSSFGNSTFYFHPCSDLPLGNHSGENDCTSGTSACLLNGTTGTFHNLGSSTNTSFFSIGVTGFPILFYSYNNITTAIGLRCAFVNQSALNYIDEHNNKNITYLFELQSRWACPVEIFPSNTTTTSASTSPSSGLSTGSVLVIIFLVFVTTYFVGGAIALKLLRGAEGREMIPNYDFWVDLPNLVKDGTTFVFNGCQTTPSYDRI
ncbi:hypothetical protein L9F63_022331 [Diploptera punctata]|uniref:Cation-dependent mannose-6-phosphate receptor n=1 Tax=Diploptera punctata TaxID=6984 RepID=A0AAD7ZM83_DIPPU|nr:hypothetical protein L9F63_022331 [Diploptera punctata]